MEKLIVSVFLTLLLFGCNSSVIQENELCNENTKSIIQITENIFVYRNYIEGLACAKTQNKPILLYFTAHATCSRKHEDILFKSKTFQSYLAKHYIPIFLYVDDRTKVEQPYPIDTSSSNSRMIRTTGNMYANFQIEKFNSNSQPLFCILDTNENSLVEPVDYQTAIQKEEFLEFLKSGVEAFNK